MKKSKFFLIATIFILHVLSADAQRALSNMLNGRTERIEVTGKDSTYLIRPVLKKGEQPDVLTATHRSTPIFYSKDALHIDAKDGNYIYFLGRTDHGLTAYVTSDHGSEFTISGGFKALYFNALFSIQRKGPIFFEGIETDTLRVLAQMGFSIDRSKIKVLALHPHITCGNFSITNSSLDSCSFGDNVPDTCTLANVDLSSMKGRVKFNLNYIWARRKPLLLNLAEVDLKKLDFPLGLTDVRIDSRQDYTHQAELYQTLLKLYQENGYTEKYEIYDKEFQEIKYLYNHHPILNFFDKYWWDYGYAKARVLFLSFFIFLIFTLLNLLCYDKLQEVYWPDKFRDHDLSLTERYAGNDQRVLAKKMFKKSMSVILYTGFLFWGLRFEIKDIALKNRYVVLLVILQYITGVVCLAFIAHFILSR